MWPSLGVFRALLHTADPLTLKCSFRWECSGLIIHSRPTDPKIWPSLGVFRASFHTADLPTVKCGYFFYSKMWLFSRLGVLIANNWPAYLCVKSSFHSKQILLQSWSICWCLDTPSVTTLWFFCTSVTSSGFKVRFTCNSCVITLQTLQDAVL